MEYEKLIDESTLYDWERIQNHVQASNGEILKALPELLIAEIDGTFFENVIYFNIIKLIITFEKNFRLLSSYFF